MGCDRNMLKEKMRYLCNRRLHRKSESVFEGISKGRKKALDNWFKDQWRQVDGIEKTLRSSSDEREAFGEIVWDMQNRYEDFLEVFIVDGEGTVISSSFTKHIGDAYSAFPNYQKGKNNEQYMYGPYCDKKTLDIISENKLFADEVTLMFSKPFANNNIEYILYVRVLNDDMSNIIQEEDTHVYKESGDNYLFMIHNNRGILPGTAISRSRFEDRTFTHGENLKDGVKTSRWGTVKIKEHTEFEIQFTDPATNELHKGVQATIDNGENLDCWPGYPDYRHILVGGKGTQIIPPYSDEVWGMMCEGDIAEIYHFNGLTKIMPISMAFITAMVAIISLLAEKYLTTAVASILYIGIVSVAMYILTKRLIVKPINSTVKILRNIAEGEGDLTKRVTINAPNEIGELGRWFNKFISNQMHMIRRVGNSVKSEQHAIKRVTKASKKIEGSIASIDDTINVLTNNSIKQNSLFRNTQTEVLKIAESFQKNEELQTMMKEIQSKTASTSEAAESAKDVTKQVLSSIDELESAMGNAVSSIGQLGLKSQAITNIVSTIASISNQTNPAAPIASIEAPTAGDPGRGFALVAEEIKKLSMDTQEATKVIEGLILAIQKEIGNTNSNIEVIDEKVKVSVKSTRESTKAVELVVDVSNSISTILDIMEDENAVIMEVSSNISDMASKSEESVQIGEESNQLAKDKIQDIMRQVEKLEKVLEGLEYSSNDLDEIVGAFQVTS